MCKKLSSEPNKFAMFIINIFLIFFIIKTFELNISVDFDYINNYTNYTNNDFLRLLSEEILTAFNISFINSNTIQKNNLLIYYGNENINLNYLTLYSGNILKGYCTKYIIYNYNIYKPIEKSIN